jgi:glycerophosphoryl diester phosphodiesterase
MIDVRRRDGAPPLRVGHKGAAALAPENTLPSFRAALEHGVDLIEFDVLALRDGQLVLAHSNDLLEVSHGAAHGSVVELSLPELRRVAPRLPTFDEACAFLAVEAPEVGVHVDVKWVDYEADVVETLRRHGLVGRTLVSSFFSRSLRAIGAVEPGLRLGLSYPLDRRGISGRRALAPLVWAGAHALRRALPYRIGRWLEAAGATVATLHHLLVSPAVVRTCHARGAAVFAWTVDDPAVVRALAARGVDGVITNDPRIFAGTLPGP